MSQIISQSQLYLPADSTLPRHAMFRQTIDHEWHINLYMLFKNLPKPRGSRAIWYKTSQSMVQKLPSDIFEREIREICAVLYDQIGKNTWISVRSALVLLTYGSRNHKHLEVALWVEQYTGIRLPRPKGLSRREVVFGHKLRAFIDAELTSVTYGDYELYSQHRMCNGKYYVDFAVKHYWNGDEDSSNYHLYLIEFDEEEHALSPNKAADLIRDTEIKKEAPHTTIIRVKHDESDDWFDLVRENNRLIGFESAFLDGIITACRTVEGDSLIIDSNSAMKAYDSRQNVNADMLTHEKQPLRGIKEALKKCGIRCNDCRTKKQRQLQVPLESFATTLHRWLPAKSVEHILSNLKSS
ncbi:hypothetical protein ACRZ6Q_004216 [Citrobacter freundii]|uniref:hypothetical protein n=1 Tax=Enterobacteriaceae TaxID=543 RepID=UPI0006520117|nr:MULTISPECIES: hypothetical protein [Enterobacteriaceae]HCB1682685.1 hypothetical protein [Citrobacter braakii]EJN7218961.1 hypothetical protein [Citrobacter freundii]EKW2054407.1 hypothetical protein [Citrobacter freundii]KLV86788.1 hypothetical protein SK37_00374 [Citrobacter sp. MGH109]MBD5703350.1 hypothetical protein [Citrobacter freundii]